MIGQHDGEPRRKLLELPRHSIVAFFAEDFAIISLEIETKGADRVLRKPLGMGELLAAVAEVGRRAPAGRRAKAEV